MENTKDLSNASNYLTNQIPSSNQKDTLMAGIKSKQTMGYNLKTVEAPVLAGWSLLALTWVVEFFGSWTGLSWLLMNNGGMFALRSSKEFSSIPPTFEPLVACRDDGPCVLVKLGQRCLCVKTNL
jgi:hypothetical protein